MPNDMLKEDIRILGSSDCFDALAGSTILVTGSTGLIGSLIVLGALAHNDSHEGKVRVVALARSRDKAARVLGDAMRRDDLRVVYGDVTALPEIDEPIDWISHGASITSSAAFAAHPVEVARTEVDGTVSLLELARCKQVRGMVFLSSLEVYGDVEEGHGEVFEDYGGSFDRLKPRNSYPAAKCLCESLCAAYASEYGVPVKIARLAQTFGAGASPDDRRVFAQFARAAQQGTPIVMHTPGTGCRCYCYTTDVAEGLMTILAKGDAGQAYNVSNPRTYCSVREMAEMIVERYRDGGVSLEFDFPEDLSSFGYAAPSFVRLNSDRLMALGWRPRYDLPEMYDRLVSSFASSA